MADEKKPDPPEIGQGQEIEGGASSPGIGQGQDIEGGSSSPGIGQGEDITGEPGGDKTTSPDKGQDEALDKLQKLMEKKGFKDVGALVDSYGNLETRNTQLGSDVRKQNFVLPPPSPAPSPVDVSDFEIPDDMAEIITDKGKLKELMGNFAKEIQRRTLQGVNQDYNQRRSVELYNEASQKIEAEGVEKFNKLRPAMRELANEPEYRNANFSQLWSAAERKQKQDREGIITEIKKEMGMEDVDKDRLKTLVSKLRPAQVSDASGGGGEGIIEGKGKEKDDAAFMKDILDAEFLKD